MVITSIKKKMFKITALFNYLKKNDLEEKNVQVTFIKRLSRTFQSAHWSWLPQYTVIANLLGGGNKN